MRAEYVQVWTIYRVGEHWLRYDGSHLAVDPEAADAIRAGKGLEGMLGDDYPRLEEDLKRLLPATHLAPGLGIPVRVCL